MKIGSVIASILAAAAVVVGVVGVVESGREEPRAESAPEVPEPHTVVGAVRDTGDVRVVGLMLNGETRQPDPSGTKHQLAFFGSFDRTRVALELFRTEGGLIDLVNQNSSVDVFEDDAGTDLRRESHLVGPFELTAQVAEDGRSVVFVAASEKRPARRAKTVRVAGTAELMVAHETRVDSSEVVEPKGGTRLVFGPHELEIKEAGESSWGDGWSLTVESKRDLAPVVSWAWSDAEGNLVELRTSMSMSGMGTWQQTLECPTQLGSGSLVVESWQDPEALRVPFDVRAGIGF